MLWVAEKGAAVFIVTTLVNNGVNGILGVIGEVVDLIYVVMKVKNLRLRGFCKWLRVTRGWCIRVVDGVGVLVFFSQSNNVDWCFRWFRRFFLLKSVCLVLNWVIVFPTIRWTDVFVGILVVKNVGLFELELLGANKRAIVIGTGVLVFPINILVLTSDVGDRDAIEFAEINW